ncbi:acetyltransferase, GNAT family, putative [Plasmodium knowlesi strain H]|uniref:N-alpha-acetyltransferase 40 n=3 Tax=Plasmodium knowlesi TaxID=5850 RepID=A0A5K1UWT0_PLAKH|nr:N-acetyltransferase, GNAT family, putative [Plasmodium knowlesi strain H]OTN65528.1 putative Acetyltransferase - (GNAT) family [Plasmodium knowlesi]CAA9989381.1 N-acetyltransferase, GNAT family, putative [Plasmodium knowlesi strain H]SBO24969.1 acetyltransferase, GNAT family, putative [Plasmodium knowlesi strain H]SBO27891.1 acetyltransferase, GNAT family, putative [Plasmodium knowlesi strain H]VVS78855.1 N-acetyltransferase, GNAT family, putative [Plasmodium knowlesi strain H]|eukprot:XP_002260108.1 Acetyltransferase, (GNAT) family, putative [Plasmodium knowlesi strain H]
MENEREKEVVGADTVGTGSGKSCKIRKTNKSIQKKGCPKKNKKEHAKYNNGEVIKVVKNCKHNDSIFDFIDGSYRKYFLVKRGNGVDPHTQMRYDSESGKSADSSFISFESINAFELKKHQEGEAVFSRLFHMTKANMERLYNDSNFLNRGWSDEKKWKELRSDKCKLILGFVQKDEVNEEGVKLDEENVSESGLTRKEHNFSFLQRVCSKGKNESTKDVDDYLKKHPLVCFVHYRLTGDYPPNAHRTICYLYEIQIVPEFTKLGIGKRLINMLEALCRRINVDKIVCTVLKNNVNAVSFYKTKCSFEMDESSPDNFASEDSEECEYEILKRVVCNQHA